MKKKKIQFEEKQTLHYKLTVNSEVSYIVAIEVSRIHSFIKL